MIFTGIDRHKASILAHYESVWDVAATEIKVLNGPIHELPHDFAVLEFPPHGGRNMWTYATCCMSTEMDSAPLELHMFAAKKTREIVEILVATAHYHRTEKALGLGHTVNFGKSWVDESPSKYGLLSLPYLDGPELEGMQVGNGSDVKFLWLIPVTLEEVEYKKEHGLDRLEELFEVNDFNFIDPMRNSVCASS
jgi:hypothetical protein